MKNYLFTSESVSEGHPDKVADQISDALLDAYLEEDSNSHVAIETLCTKGLVVVAGEVRSNAKINVDYVVRKTIKRIGYNKSEYMFDADSCGVINAIHEQSQDINRGVERGSFEEQGAGDQGMMFGYACSETDAYMPLPIYLAHKIVKALSKIRKEMPEMMPYLRPDSKSQVTIEYDGETNKPLRIDTIVVSTQHDDFAPNIDASKAIEEDVRKFVIPLVRGELPVNLSELFKSEYKLYVNPTGKFVIGGPAGDTGLTGRKIIVDTYGGRGAHGGGAFSGKDASKVDRSAAYMARYIAKNLVAAGVSDECLVQLSYAIGMAEPVSVYVNTYGKSRVDESDSEIADYVKKTFDLRPGAIIKKLGLKSPIFKETASYGHFGREADMFHFRWEALDSVNSIKKSFDL